MGSSLGIGLTIMNLTTHPLALIALFIFIIAYLFVVLEEFTHLKKCKPVLLSAGFIWAITAFLGQAQGNSEWVNTAFQSALLEFSELFLFLLVAMTYVNAMEERQIFKALGAFLIRQNFSYRKLFWITGLLSFFLSPFLDNLTTALIMGTVVITVGHRHPVFTTVGCINVVVASNAGGAFTPFGDVTTLMVWQYGAVSFFQFLDIFFPSLVAFLVPALLMYRAIPVEKALNEKKSVSMDGRSEISATIACTQPVILRPGAKRVVILFALTILTAIGFHQWLHLPPMLGMMTGLGYLSLFGYFIERQEHKKHKHLADLNAALLNPFDILKKMEKIEWDTLLFFYGVMLSIAGLAALGYLHIASQMIYEGHNLTMANTSVGILSAFLGNIPVLYALLMMHPVMPTSQWLLLTLTTGIGGNLLSIGSAAGIALMGQSQGKYTFFSHLKWLWAIALGYFLAILLHSWLN